MKSYKHFVTVTSQLYFCSSPIRLDSYNRCQFGCVYCFSRKRAIESSDRVLKKANPAAFAKRLERVSQNNIRSALDEFLQNRVPIQLGGLQDPFSAFEQSNRTTLDLLHILCDHKYPTLISTKGNLFLKDEYIDVLARMNVYVRISAAAVPEEVRLLVDAGGDRFNQTLRKIEQLLLIGCPVSLRIQPIFPGFEAVALQMAVRASEAGVKHISFEHLKLGTEGLEQQCNVISSILKTDIWQEMQRRGLTRVGRDYTLVREAKLDFVKEAKLVCSNRGVRFGAGDTEYIHLSDGNGCCNSSSYFLKDANQFRANFVGILSNRAPNETIKFSDLIDEWCPTKAVHTYLTTDSRGRDKTGRFNSWLSLMAHRWNGGNSPYCPEFFHGVTWTGEFDEMGFKTYQYLPSREFF